MRRSILPVLLLAATMFSAVRARAWLAYPSDDDPGHLIVEVEGAAADIVRLKDLPEPFSRLVAGGAAQNASFRWRYERFAEGKVLISIDASGRATLRFDFAIREPLAGRRYGAALSLLTDDGRAMHTFYALADRMPQRGDEAPLRYGVELELARPPAWWREVAALAFFRMTYHPQQKLAERETWRAMRRAVWRVTQGEGTEQRE